MSSETVHSLETARRAMARLYHAGRHRECALIGAQILAGRVVDESIVQIFAESSLQLGRPAAAWRALEAVMPLRHHQSYDIAARTARVLDRPEDAIRLHRMAVVQAPADAAWIRNLANTQFRTCRFVNFGVLVKWAYCATRGNSEGPEDILHWMLQRGQQLVALAYCRDLVEHGGGTDRILRLKSRCESGLGLSEAAAESLWRAAKMAPSNTLAAIQAAQLHALIGQPGKAMRMLVSLAAVAVQNAAVYRVMAFLEGGLGAEASAQKEWRRARSIDPLMKDVGPVESGVPSFMSAAEQLRYWKARLVSDVQLGPQSFIRFIGAGEAVGDFHLTRRLSRWNACLKPTLFGIGHGGNPDDDIRAPALVHAEVGIDCRAFEDAVREVLALPPAESRLTTAEVVSSELWASLRDQLLLAVQSEKTGVPSPGRSTPVDQALLGSLVAKYSASTIPRLRSWAHGRTLRRLGCLAYAIDPDHRLRRIGSATVSRLAYADDALTEGGDRRIAAQSGQFEYVGPLRRQAGTEIIAMSPGVQILDENSIRRSENEVTYIYSFRNATVLPGNLLVTKDGTLVDFSSVVPLHDRNFDIPSPYDAYWRDHVLCIRNGSAAMRVPKVQKYLDCPVLLVTPIEHAENFGHFIYEILPSVAFYNNNNSNEEWCLILHSDVIDFQEQFLRLLGVSARQIVLIPPDCEVHAPKISVIQRPRSGMFNFAMHDRVKEIFLSVEVPPSRFGRKLYLSRRLEERKRLLNEDEIEALLVKRGFDVVHMGTLPVADQIAAIRAADVVVGGHGSAFSSAVFASGGKKIVEFVNTHRPEALSAFWHRLGNDYYWVRARQLDQTVSKYRSTYYLEPGQLESLLSAIL